MDSEINQIVENLKKVQEIYTNMYTVYNETDIKSSTCHWNKHLLTYLNSHVTKPSTTTRKRSRTYGNDEKHHGKLWLTDEYDYVKEHYTDSESIISIAQYLGRTTYSIECVLLKLNLVTTTVKHDIVYYIKNNTNITMNSFWTIEKTEKLVKCMKEKFDTKSIECIFNIDPESVRDKIKQLQSSIDTCQSFYCQS